MLAAFCARLALGVLIFLCGLIRKPLPPRFPRTLILVALGALSCVAVLGRPVDDSRDWLVIVALAVCFLAALAWSLHPAPWGQTLLLSAVFCGTLCVFQTNSLLDDSSPWGWFDPILSSAVLGYALGSMLVGHAYLIAPGLPITVLLNALRGLAVCLGLRLAGVLLAWHFWTSASTSSTLDMDLRLGLVFRLGVGFVLPAIFTAMAWASARIRSTQSATGILFVVVVCVVLGELMGIVLGRWLSTPL